MTADPSAFKQILDNIPERDQNVLLSQHSITDFAGLAAKKTELQQRQLKDVCPDVQMVLEVVCSYLESLDSTSTFTWEGFENFCDYNDNSGDTILEDLGDEVKQKANKTAEDSDPDGYNLTAEERKQMEQNVENDPLTMTVRGFSSPALQFEFDEHNKQKLVDDSSDKTEVAFNGSVYYAKKCYYYQQPNGETVTVGIRKFTRNEKKAICALVVAFKETIMGPRLEEVPPIGIPATYEEAHTDFHVQVREKPGSEPIVPLSALRRCIEPSDMPDLMFERQQVGQPPHNFGFVYESDGANRAEEREEIRFVDFFAGSGGFHQGVTQEPKMKGAAAVECWDTACKTFEKNNPETPVYCETVEDFLEKNGPKPADFRKNLQGSVECILWSSPCQSFSRLNRDVDHNGEKDLYRKRLSLKFVDAMQSTGALIGVLENVEGMWARPNVYFLKKIVLDLLRTGHQVRVRLHVSHAFGDPQARPRLLIYAAKKFVEMPNVIETHGPGMHPYMTVGNAFNALDKALERAENDPDADPLPNLQGSTTSKPGGEGGILNLDRPAGTISCGGRVWHPAEDRAITVREAAAIQSYPHRYEFVGSVTDQYKQVGNAVPGRMATAVARAIAESLRFVYDEEGEGADDDKEETDE